MCSDDETHAAEAPHLHAEIRGSGPPLVLLHGGVGSWNHWVRNIDALAERFTVYAVDLPAFGRSPGAPRDIAKDDYMALCRAGVDALLPAGARFSLAGFSFGGIIGGHIAATFGERLRRVTLISPGGMRAYRLDDPPYRRMPGDDAPEAERRAVIRHNLLQLMLHHPDSADEEAVDLQWCNIRHARIMSQRVGGRHDLLADLQRIRCPLQVLLGEHDTVIYPSPAERMAHIRAAAPQVRFDMIPGAGHWMQFERAATVNRVMLDFLTAQD
jgi:pimeloyl-ACP methyl ester carboxylesterase